MFAAAAPLEEFSYGEVSLQSEIHNRQLQNTHEVLMGLEDDALLKPFRQMVGQPAPGRDLGGWYRFDPAYKPNDVGDGFAPAATFGQWISALSRSYAIRPDPVVKERVVRLNRLYAQTISPKFYGLSNRFPAYCYDKLVCGLIDAHQYVGDPDALRILEHTTDTAVPLLPGHAVEHGTVWRSVKDDGYTWDESYTISENLFLAYRRGAGRRYRDLGKQYLDDTYYDPLAAGRSDLEGRHAYSHVNSLCSAMQAYLTLGDEKYFRAARNGFDFVLAQSFATGGWGADETLRAPNSPEVAASLTKTHHSFETPCGSYAHFKLTRYLLRVTRDSRYGDSMERVMYNTILGALPLMPDGRTFYYSDYNFKGSKFYHDAKWPCCSGTMPQIATDYNISTYFRDPQGVYVNLYIPSTVRWSQHGTQITLTQSGGYPLHDRVEFKLDASRSTEFSIRFRIPEWAEGAEVYINGKLSYYGNCQGTFLHLRQQWKDGDVIQLHLPLKLRLIPIDAAHPDTVALVSGPLVLFGTGSIPADLRAKHLYLAKKVAADTWQAQTPTGTLTLLPFISIRDERYSTYMIVKD